MTTGIDPWAITGHDEAQAMTAYPDADQQSHQQESELDELAVVQVVDDGLRLPLRGADRDEAVRRMHGRIEVHLIAWRLHTTTRTVHRVAARLGLTEHHTLRRELVTTSTG
ncbi:MULTISPECIES: hypothetical protein [Mycobacterium avium complex (MAC)]|uniref:Uncharacterized protein n=1 Tax=Mycobacterium avium subsp. hominissuis TaxID=439334 RepID=A0A187NBD2_MYCAV|nr:hypothetical protein [Mycobacterium avium]AKT73030.1 hypothetical protein MASH_00031 [Mycobacterium avium subsp. hominissuis]MBZ4526706.1 hypothetical protein [Mycobacterium avium subsp. hominissuis]MBZ4546011.1 hypothetical protein [Mycobacterium avium subsp. hominissuis]MBZ4557926.1 hypothetical protein [Mycobacterium avium subsp. hominissuis]MBZ4567627.1 hypothetical protein [Mycobacterium avium subsp. hominissuis]